MNTLSKWAVAISAILLSAPAWAPPVQVPEPDSAWLLGLGVAGIVAATFRKRK